VSLVDPGKEIEMSHVRQWMTVILLGVLFGATGCMGAKSTWMYPHENTETLGETPDEHRHRVVTSLEQDRKSLNEDLDLLFMTDRPTRLTRWHSR